MVNKLGLNANTHHCQCSVLMCTSVQTLITGSINLWAIRVPPSVYHKQFSKVKHNLEKVDAVLSTQGLNQFGVHWFIHTVGQDAQVSLTSATHTKNMLTVSTQFLYMPITTPADAITRMQYVKVLNIMTLPIFSKANKLWGCHADPPNPSQ